jgi:uncharacterized ferritin-like protein (DUF455 family)
MIREAALHALMLCDPAEKVAATKTIELTGWTDSQSHWLAPEGHMQEIPGRPERPLLVHPQKVERRKLGSRTGHAALIHAIAHIEFNAINLALDVIWRFGGFPQAFYADWLRVAQEEAEHFSLLACHLQSLGFTYGDFSAHDGLWTMAERTKDSALARLALVPRTLEARGLDASPAIRERLFGIGDAAGAAIIERILNDEIGHVAIGNRWYRWVCERDRVDPEVRFSELAIAYSAPRLKAPINTSARRAAGFSDTEIAQMIAEAALPPDANLRPPAD